MERRRKRFKGSVKKTNKVEISSQSFVLLLTHIFGFQDVVVFSGFVFYSISSNCLVAPDFKGSTLPKKKTRERDADISG